MTRTFRIVLTFALAFASACTPDPTVEPEQTVEVLRDIELTARARIPENDPAFQSVEVFTDHLVFHYTSAPAEGLGMIDLGAVGTYTPVVAGSRGGGYLREVTSVREIAPNVFEASTGPAFLTDLIARGHFRVHQNPHGDSFVEGDNVAAAIAPLEGDVTLLPVGLNDACDFSSGGSIEVEPILNLNVDFDIDIDIDVNATWRPPFVTGELQSADFVMSGSLELGANVTASTNGTVSCEVDLIDFARERGINVPKREWGTTFFVGPVPVYLSHTVGPTAAISISGSVETGTATASSSVTYSIRAGSEYRRNDGGWREVWEPRRTSSGSFEVGMPGTVTIEASLSAGVEYECKLYDVLGPKIGLEGSLTGTFTSDLCEWTGEVGAGISVTGGGSIEVPVIDQTLVEFSISQELASITLWEDMGTWPWCRDGGEMDAGMSESDAPVTDPCSSLGDCASCNAMAGCGFCVGSGTCMNDSRMGECSVADWRDAPFECTDCSGASNCADCVNQADCGWCGGSGSCMTSRVGGAAPTECGSGWYFNPAEFCPGG